MDPRAYANVMAFSDPNVYMKWLAAGMDPNFYTALLTQMSDPGKMMRWAMMPMDPKMWSMMMQGLNPAMYMKWMMLPLDPKMMQLGMNTMNPNLYMSWLGATMDPKSYGSWGTWLAPMTAPVAGAAPTFAWPTAPTTGGYPNPLDPNVWTQMMTAPFAAVPGMALPMAPVAPAAAPASK
jgi:hypothetical protein